jgi:NADH-quinone oxidoreductase subunit C
MSDITNEHLLSRLRAQFGEFIYNESTPYELATIVLHKDKIVEVLSWLYKDPEFKFQFLTDLCGIHFPEAKGAELGVIYHIHSLTNNLRLRIKCFMPAENPTISTITSVFLAANWQERETYDFFGIQFEGHPDLRRILNVDEMDYFPMRKEYPLEDGTRTDKEDQYFGR